MDFQPQFLLIPLLLCIIPVGAVWIIWRFTFKRSTKKVFMALLAALLNRQDRVDPNAPIPVPEHGGHISDMMDDMAEDTSRFDAQLLRNTLEAQSAEIPATDQDRSGDSEAASFPMRIGKSLRRMRHPFRQIRLETENENLNEDKYHGDA